MSFWDDVVRNVFGGGQKEQPKKDTPKQSPLRSSSPAQGPVNRPALVASGLGRQGTSRSGGTAPSPGPAENPYVSNPYNAKGAQTHPVREFGNFLRDAGTNTGNFVRDIVPNTEKFLKTPVKAPFDPIVQGTKEGKNLSPLAYDKDTDTWTLEGPFGNPDSLQKKHDERVNKAPLTPDARQTYFDSFGKPGARQVVELTDEQWAGLSPEQQKGVIANYALYQASLADQELAIRSNNKEEVESDYGSRVNDLFGKEGGSDRYAPNTVRVLEELGYQTKRGDLDLFLNGSAIATYDDLLGKSPEKERAPRLEAFNELSGSKAFQNDQLTAMLESGSSLIDSIGAVDVFSDATKSLAKLPKPALSQLNDEQASTLDDVLTGMSDQLLWSRIQEGSEPEKAARLQQMLSDVTNQVGEDTVTNYFLQRYDEQPEARPGFMSREEFINNWIKQKG